MLPHVALNFPERVLALEYRGGRGDLVDWQTVWLGSPLITMNNASTFCLQFNILLKVRFKVLLRYDDSGIKKDDIILNQQPPLGPDWIHFDMDVVLPTGVEAFHVLFHFVTNSTSLSGGMDDIRITGGSCLDLTWSSHCGNSKLKLYMIHI